MTVNGIIAEYNPLHQGHIYQMQDAAGHTGADYTIVVMSGNFVQRGAPAITDKFSRTQMALNAGADLVLELPLPYAVSSAEYFASGGVSLLNSLGVVTHLCFGSEAGATPALQEIAEILVQEPPSYSHALQTALKNGQSFPAARTRALFSYAPHLAQYSDLLDSPNNILAIEYLKSLYRTQSSIQPYTTLRTGNGYNDDSLDEYSSALAIRKALLSGQSPEVLKQHIPACTTDILLRSDVAQALIGTNDFSSMLRYKLRLHANEGYTDFLDVSEQLSERILNHLDNFRDFDSFCQLLKTREITYTRITRCLLHILLDMPQSILVPYEESGIPYARVLGFRRDAAPLLSAIKHNTNVPLITKLADAHKTLNPGAMVLLQEEIKRSSIYYDVLASKTGSTTTNEYRTPLVII